MTPAGWRTRDIVLDSLTLAARLALGAIFAWASWFKIIDPNEFAMNIATYQILPESVVNLMAIVLPWIELAAGVLLVAGALTRESAVAVAGMLAVFIAAIGIAMSKDLQISCGCFASEAAKADIGWPKIAEDSAMLAGAVWIAIRGSGRLGLDALAGRWRGSRPGPTGGE